MANKKSIIDDIKVGLAAIKDNWPLGILVGGLYLISIVLILVGFFVFGGLMALLLSGLGIAGANFFENLDTANLGPGMAVLIGLVVFLWMLLMIAGIFIVTSYINGGLIGLIKQYLTKKKIYDYPLFKKEARGRFKSFLKLNLSVAGIAIGYGVVMFLVAGLVVALAVLTGMATEVWIGVIVGVILMIPVFLILIIGQLLISIIFGYAPVIMVTEEIRPWAAIRQSYDFLIKRKGKVFWSAIGLVLLLYLIFAGVSFGIQAVQMVFSMIMLIPFIGWVIGFTAQTAIGMVLMFASYFMMMWSNTSMMNFYLRERKCRK